MMYYNKKTSAYLTSTEQEKGNFSVGLYIRLSREDGDKIESDSIVNQRLMLDEYIKKNKDFNLFDCYIDDGYTGINFERPDFIRMIEDIEKNKINCVIVKDLSRLGRDYISTGRYLHEYFPKKNIRFISLNDAVDSLNKRYDMMLPIRNIFNEQYSRDISAKVQSALNSKQKSGKFIGAFTSYGYQKDPSNHNKLIIDEYAAHIVRKIFKLYIQGNGKIRIAKILNQEGELCPSEYKKACDLNYTNGNKLNQTSYWTYATVNRILQNQMYIGDMVQGKTISPDMKRKAEKVRKENWIIVNDTHEPIIDNSTWELAQSILNNRTKQIAFDHNTGIFSGIIRCGDCGRAMNKNKSKYVYYMCSTYKLYGNNICTRHSIRQDIIERIILNDINLILSKIVKMESLVEKARHERRSNKNIKHEIEACKMEIDMTIRKRKELYLDYKEGLLTKQDYFNFKQEFDKKENLAKKKIKLIECNSNEKLEKIIDKPWVKKLVEKGRIEKLDRQLVVQLIKCIKVFEEKRVEITYKFAEQSDSFIKKPN